MNPHHQFKKQKHNKIEKIKRTLRLIWKVRGWAAVKVQLPPLHSHPPTKNQMKKHIKIRM
jgi:hypothetical protein